MTALFDISDHAPPFSPPRLRMAPMIARKIIAQIRPYSIDVAPRLSRRIAVRSAIMTWPLPAVGDRCRFSRERPKIFLTGEPCLQNFSTPLLVVAVALIDGTGRILLQRRRLSSEHGGLWEFPGGKVEAGETPQIAAVREIEEELGLRLDAAALAPLTFAADTQPPPPPGRSLVILLYTCRVWQGEIASRAGEEVRWCEFADIADLAMPPLDYPLAAALKLVI